MAGETYTFQNPEDCFPEAAKVAQVARIMMNTRVDGRPNNRTTEQDYIDAHHWIFGSLITSSREFAVLVANAGLPDVSTINYNPFLK